MSVQGLNRSADIGDKMLQVMVDESEINFEKYLDPIPEAERVKPAQSYEQALVDRFYGENPDPGCYLPWQKSHSQFKFRPGELSIWAGTNSHGKSMLISQVVLYLMAQSQKCCIASMEMKPLATLQRQARQFVGSEAPTIQALRGYMTWCAGRLWIYDQIGTVKAERMLAVARHCIREIGIQHFVIDSLMKCGIGSDDYNRQKHLVDELSTLAKDTGSHIHLVAHSRKGETEHKVIDKFDIKGASEITDMADNVLIVWKNRQKEDGDNSVDPDAMLIIDKQRNGEHTPKYRLFYHRPSFQSMTWAGDGKAIPEDYQRCRWMA